MLVHRCYPVARNVFRSGVCAHFVRLVIRKSTEGRPFIKKGSSPGLGLLPFSTTSTTRELIISALAGFLSARETDAEYHPNQVLLVAEIRVPALAADMLVRHWYFLRHLLNS
jgi:hypothetical protein